MVYTAEYIWIDAAKPTAKMRSKTKVISDDTEPMVWAFDGSSTGQASGSESDCVLKPVHIVPDPIRGLENKLVLCEVYNTDDTPHPSNTRAKCRKLGEKYSSHEMIFGLEQEYTFFEGAKPLLWPERGFPAPQGGYYCGVGADEVYGSDIVSEHLEACIEAGLSVSGINSEVMPAQWEFQIGALPAPLVADEIWIGRWILYKIASSYQGRNGEFISVHLDPKPAKGDWNGAGMHTNFSTKEMRNSFQACKDACEKLRPRHDLHVANYGEGIERRLTGVHETAPWDKFNYAVSDRGASVRIPWQVPINDGGYVEDRRPNANADPYIVTNLILEAICS